MSMKIYDIHETFDVLRKYKVTTNIESIRRWLRSGTIKGVAPASRKEGWRIREEDLYTFIKERVSLDEFNATDVVKEEIEVEAREKMWWELVGKFIFEGHIEIKKTQVKEVLEHRSEAHLLDKVWGVLKEHKIGRAKPTVFYLLDHFLFAGTRIPFDENFENIDYKILFPVIEHIKKNY